ncbi:MAG TPA: hypothetical protein VF950_11555 [Planctomycetota bacterium]
MAFTIMHRLGDMERNPPLSALPLLLEELDPDDTEHVDVAVTHESGWCVSAGMDGHVTWENVEADRPPRHMHQVPASKIIELWNKLAQGDLAGVESEPWQPG